MNDTRVYDALCEKPTSTQPCLGNNLYDRLSAKAAEPVQAKEHTYYTLSPAYCVPSSDEQRIFEEFEGKKFHKLYHDDIV